MVARNVMNRLKAVVMLGGIGGADHASAMMVKVSRGTTSFMPIARDDWQQHCCLARPAMPTIAQDQNRELNPAISGNGKCRVTSAQSQWQPIRQNRATGR
jgi:hypothetical protein